MPPTDTDSQKEDLRQMLFLHAENLEQTELFFLLFARKLLL